MEREFAVLSGTLIVLLAISRLHVNYKSDRTELNSRQLNKISIFEFIYLLVYAVLSTYVYYNRNSNNLPSWYYSLQNISIVQLVAYLLVAKISKNKRKKLREVKKLS